MSVECGAIWIPRSSSTDTPPVALPIACAARRTSASSTPALAHDSAMSTARRWATSSSSPLACSASQASASSAVLHEDRQHRGEEMGVAAGERAQVDVGEVGGLGAPRVDDDQRAGGVVGEVLEDPAGLLDAVRLPRVLAPEHADLGVLEVGRGVAARPAEQLAVDPELTGLLLGEGVRRVPDAERRAGRPAVPAAEVVALPATAVEQDLVAAVLGDDVLEALGDLGDRGVPVDRLERAVGTAPQRRREPVRAVLVVVDAEALLAGVALRRGMGLVAAHPRDRRPVDADLEPAVHRAQDACGLVPGPDSVAVRSVIAHP